MNVYVKKRIKSRNRISSSHRSWSSSAAGKNKSEAKKAAEKTTVTSEPKNDYRNTERGKDKKNSKGIYTPTETTKPSQDRKNRKASNEKSAYLVGSGLAALAAACFL